MDKNEQFAGFGLSRQRNDTRFGRVAKGEQMKKRYKLVLNIDITDPEDPFPAGGDYMHLNRIQGIVKSLTWNPKWVDGVVVTVDKVIDKGEISEQ